MIQLRCIICQKELATLRRFCGKDCLQKYKENKAYQQFKDSLVLHE